MPDLHVVRDVNQIIQFGSPADTCGADCSGIDAGVRADFDIVPDWVEETTDVEFIPERILKEFAARRR